MSLGSQDKKEIEKLIKKEFKEFLSTTQAHNIVITMLQKEFNFKKLDDKIIDLSTKVVVELFKTLWQRKSFWEGPIKNVK
jgi:hypothetical protein